jgi:hypothetical protein
MKYFLILALLLFSSVINAQKFALLDEHFAEPVKYADQVTSSDKYNGFFPVEKKMLPQFIKALEDINIQLSSKDEKVKEYEVGCLKFKGRLISLASGPRTDYILTFTCDNSKITMHLCDAKVSNASNAFFIQTWLKYIKSYMK